MPYAKPEDRRARANKPENKAKQAIYLKEWRKNNPDYYKERTINDVAYYLQRLLYDINYREPDHKLTLNDLVTLWNIQGGFCSLTNLKMTHEIGGSSFDTNTSVDRIDSSKGYLKSNIRLVCFRANWIKGNITDDELLRWCSLILEHSKNPHPRRGLLDMTMNPVQISVKHKLVGVPTTLAIENLFPDARKMNGYTLIPHKPAESFMLRKMNYDVPSPILTNYDWPHPANQPPFEAQKKMAALITMNNRSYNLSGMGVGKTRSILWSFDYLKTNNIVNKMLVVAPLSTLRFTWAREVFATLPHRVCKVLHGTKLQRMQALNEPADIYIINHDGVKVMLDALHARVDINMLALDEAAVYRNGQSQRTKTMRIFAKRFEWVVGMTGAPIPTSPTDAWATASIITPNTVPRYFKGFRDELMLKVSQFKWVPKPDATERAFKALQPAVRFTLDDVVELPEAVYRTMDIELGPTQAKVYKELAQHCYVALQKGEITAANAGAVMNKLMQVSVGWVYTSEGNTAALDNDKRIEALIDVVLASEGKKMVFVPFKHALAGISHALKNEGIDHAVVSGDTSANERGEIFNLFQNTSKYQVLAAHPQCLAHGLTLTAATTIVWFSPVTSLEIYDQANMRIRRVGQKHKQLYLHFQGTPVERRIYQMLQNKQNIQGELLSLFEVATQNLSV